MRDWGEFHDFPVKKPDKEKCRFQKQRKYVTDSLAETGSPRSGPNPIDTPKKEKDIVKDVRFRIPDPKLGEIV